MCIKFEFERHKVRPNFCWSNFQIYFFPHSNGLLFLSLFPRWMQEINPVGLGNVWSGMSAEPGIRQTQQGVGHCSTNQRFFLSLVRQSVTWFHKVLAQLACLLHNVVMLWPFFCHSCCRSAVLAFFPARYANVAIGLSQLVPLFQASAFNTVLPAPGCASSQNLPL